MTGTAKRRSVKRKKWLWVLLILATAAVFGVFRLRGTVRPGYEQSVATARDIATYYTFSGKLTPVTDETQTAKDALKVKEVYASEGEPVREGEPLLRATDGTRVAAKVSGGRSLFEMVGLKELNLQGNPISQTDLEILRSALPLCSINGEKSNYQAAGDAALLQSVQMVLGGSAKNLNMESFKHLTWFDLKDAGTPEANNYSFQLLQAAVNMEVLQIMRLGINDLAPLAKMEKLKEIYAYENNISDLSPMENLKNLQFANLYGNQISDLRPLAGLHRLQILLLHMNQISDITPLLGLTNLRELDVTGNPVSSEDIERLRKALPQCRINGQLPPLP